MKTPHITPESARHYTVVNDGQFRYPVFTPQLLAWEAKHGDISGDKYDDFCNAVPCAYAAYGTPGNAALNDICEVLIDNGAARRVF